MVRKNEILGIAVVAIVCLFLIGISQKQTNDYHSRSHRFPQQLLDLEESFRVPTNITPANPSIQDVITQQRNILLNELTDYKFPQGDNLEDYTLVAGGQPVRTVIITTWRSGSTFLGKLENIMATLNLLTKHSIIFL